MSSKEPTKYGSSKAPTGSKTGHSKKRKESSSAMDSNPSQPPVSTPVDPGMHKEDQQATGGPTSLGVTSEERANPQLSSNTDPYVLADQTKSVSEGLVTKDEGNNGVEIIMVNVIPPDHMDDVPVVEPNQHDDVPIVPEPVLVDEDEDPKEDKFKEEEDPQEEENNMEVDIKEDENEPEMTYPYEEVDPLNPPPHASESEPDDEIEVEDAVESEDETVPASVHEMASLSRRLCGRETAHALVEKKGKANDKYYGKLILDLGNEVRFSVEQGTAAMEKLVERLGNTKDKVECKKLEKELEEERLSNTLLRMQNERVERDLYWTRVRAHEFYQEMICRGFVFEERPNEAIDVPIKDEKNPSSEIMPPKSALMTEAAIRRMIKESVDAAIAAERARQANRNPAFFRGVKELSNCEDGLRRLRVISRSVNVQRVKEYDVFAYTKRFNELALMRLRMVDPERVKVDAYIRGLTDNIKGEVTSSKPADLNEAVRMAHKLMEQKSQAINARILEGKKQNQKQGNTRAMVTAPTDGKLPLCERCFTRHVGQCTIKCHKCGKVGHKARYCKEKSVATGANSQPVWTCYDCGEQGQTRNRYPKKVKQEEVGEVHRRAYAIKDAKPQGPNVVTGTFLLNNRYAFVLFDSGSDRSFLNTRFSSRLDIDPVKIGASYEVELADGRVVSMNTVLKGCTLSLVNHVLKSILCRLSLGRLTSSSVGIGLLSTMPLSSVAIKLFVYRMGTRCG
ncbi:putative reverse transcriptase domain-containing protein [Tanacetum coccineum]